MSFALFIYLFKFKYCYKERQRDWPLVDAVELQLLDRRSKTVPLSDAALQFICDSNKNLKIDLLFKVLKIETSKITFFSVFDPLSLSVRRH